jgi:hypothetical protein
MARRHRVHFRTAPHSTIGHWPPTVTRSANTCYTHAHGRTRSIRPCDDKHMYVLLHFGTTLMHMCNTSYMAFPEGRSAQYVYCIVGGEWECIRPDRRKPQHDLAGDGVVAPSHHRHNMAQKMIPKHLFHETAADGGPKRLAGSALRMAA